MNKPTRSGQVERIISYDAATAGSAVNEVYLEYDDAGLLDTEYQEHDGVKDGSTPYLQYTRDTTASGGEFTKGLRPTSLRYPNGRLLHYTYGTAGSTPDSLNRLDAIKDDSGGSPGTTLTSYSYLGSNTVVIEDYEEPEVRLEYYSGGSYSGVDRFGRIVDQKWYDYGASTDRERYTYGYDRADNRLYRENTIASGLDEFYSYDDISRLTGFDRGDLNAGKTAVTGTPAREEDWTLDPTGNWTDYVQKTSGSTDLDQDRTHSVVNELTNITETTGTAWVAPAEDRNGNMITVPKPSSPADGLTLAYDAWNRLVEVEDGATVVAKYVYDGQNRRIEKHLDSESPAAPDGIDTYIHYFYNSQWQTMETRETATESAAPEELQPKHQYVWSRRYIDAPILRDENTDQDSSCDDQRFYYLNDANFNVTALVNSNGDATERYVYDPYGRTTIYDGSWSSTRTTSDYGNLLTYTGREYDCETGLHHYRNRYYHANLGRLVSRDPILYFGGINLYEYVGDSPLVRTDPTGNKCTCPGCKWTFAGAQGGIMFIGGYNYARVTARCTKAELRAYRHYDCGEGCAKFRKAIHCYCEATIGMHIFSIGLQAGVGGCAIFGSFSACTDEDIGGGVGWSYEAHAIIGVEAGGDFSGDDEGDYGGGGISPGVGIGINVNVANWNVRSSGLKCVREPLNATEKYQAKHFRPCTHEDKRVTPVQIVRNPYATRPPGTISKEAEEADDGSE